MLTLHERQDRARALYNWLTAKQVQARLRVPLCTVYAHIEAGTLQSVDVRPTGGSRSDYRINPEWVEEFEMGSASEVQQVG